jgi:glycosyltransferase involved in cell wall biosynthesis
VVGGRSVPSVADTASDGVADGARAGVDLSIIVPVLDEADTLAVLVDEVTAALAAAPATWYEIVFVDDGSRDGSWTVICSLTQRFGSVRGVRLRRNLGKAAAIEVGVAHSSGRVIITMDADLQDDAAEIPRFLAELDGGQQLVCGWKRVRRDPWSKRVPSRLFNRVTGLATGVRLHDHNCGFKAARRQVFEHVPLYGELHRFVPAVAHSLGYRVGEIPVNHRPRSHGRSKYGLERYLRGFLDLLTVVMLTRYGRRPGHLFGGLGAAFGLAGFVILAYLTGLWIFTDEAIGARPLLMLGVLLEVLAVQLVSLGILSELIMSRTRSSPSTDLIAELARGARHSPPVTAAAATSAPAPARVR